MMVAALDEIVVALTPVMTAPAFVVKMVFTEVVDIPWTLFERAWKLYVMDAFRPVSVTVCEVTSVLLTSDCDP